MSMDHGGQSDPWTWGVEDNSQESDWNNGWSNTAPPQNFHQQPKNGSQETNRNLSGSTSDYFDNVRGGGGQERLQQQQTSNGRGPPRGDYWGQGVPQTRGPHLERVNNNTEVENREVAPPQPHPPHILANTNSAQMYKGPPVQDTRGLKKPPLGSKAQVPAPNMFMPPQQQQHMLPQQQNIHHQQPQQPFVSIDSSVFGNRPYESDQQGSMQKKPNFPPQQVSNYPPPSGMGPSSLPPSFNANFPNDFDHTQSTPKPSHTSAPFQKPLPSGNFSAVNSHISHPNDEINLTKNVFHNKPMDHYTSDHKQPHSGLFSSVPSNQGQGINPSVQQNVQTNQFMTQPRPPSGYQVSNQANAAPSQDTSKGIPDEQNMRYFNFDQQSNAYPPPPTLESYAGYSDHTSMPNFPPPPEEKEKKIELHESQQKQVISHNQSKPFGSNYFSSQSSDSQSSHSEPLSRPMQFDSFPVDRDQPQNQQIQVKQPAGPAAPQIEESKPAQAIQGPPLTVTSRGPKQETLRESNLQRFSPSPLQKARTPPASHLATEARQQMVETPVPPSAYQNSQLPSRSGLLLPVASSSPFPENQERIPENREFPDNAEDLAQAVTGLAIGHNRETDQDTQRHCSIDRNQYLETGHFSAPKETQLYVQQSVETNDESEAPPPGLDRLVTGQGYERWRSEPEDPPISGLQSGGEVNSAAQLAPYPPGRASSASSLSSIGGESEGREGESGGERRREVPGEAEPPLHGRVVLGQVPTPPQSQDPRGDRDRGDRDHLERMVVGEMRDQGPQGGANTTEDYRQQSRHRHRHPRRTDSYDDEERDYSSDRDRRKEDHRRRDDNRPRRRREHRSPEYRSDEEYEDRRGYHRSGRESRRRDYSPERSYYREVDSYYRERGDDHRRGRRYEQYSGGRDYDEVYSHPHYRENRSRPVSRSGSDYRHPSHLDYHHPSRTSLSNRINYYDHNVSTSSMQDYTMKFNQRTMEYFETLRRTDPAAYAAWYRQYMSGRLLQQSAATASYTNDRASVHSGRSSSNQRQDVHTPQDTVDDFTREEEEAVDYTPKLYNSAHIRGKLDSHGRLVLVDPHYPSDKQRPTVNLCRVHDSTLDPDTAEFFKSPGPFIPGVTHRNTVLQYLKRISDTASKSSEKLLYDLIYMTVKANGEVNGSDVAELLMESYKGRRSEEREQSEERSRQPLPEKEVVARFRELLQQGNKTEALQWAIEEGAWGHALFLASKMDDRTHNNIMLRFANSIPHNDPLQTLYQLMSGYVPQASTYCADKKWSDWRPHLAMILSNPTGKYGPDDQSVDRKAIISLGDSLNASGRLFASHFCYVTAQIEFTTFQPDAKLVLLGSSPNQEFNKFATCRAIMLTMCYEYGIKLRQPRFSIPTLQMYKLLLGVRLLDHGRAGPALQYCELLASEALTNRSLDTALMACLIEFSSRLKMLDPTLALTGDTARDPEWLASLKQLYEQLPEDYDPRSNALSQRISPLTVSESGHDLEYGGQEHQHLEPPRLTYAEPIPTYNPVEVMSGYSGQAPLMQAPGQQLYVGPGEPATEDSGYHQGYHQGAPVQPHLSMGYQGQQTANGGLPSLGMVSGAGGGYAGGGDVWERRGSVQSQPQSLQQSEPLGQPSSLQPQQKNNFFKASEEQLKLNEVGGNDAKKDTKNGEKSSSKTDEQNNSGWFGGIWDKLAFRPKNQMRLPDDKNPSIVWDEKKKRWVNLDGDVDAASETKPPPKVTEMQQPAGPGPGSTGLPPPSSANKYKLQKGKLMKSNYVDVMGNREKGDQGRTLEGLLPSMPPPPKHNFFIPQPVEGNESAPVDFLTPVAMNPQGPVNAPGPNTNQDGSFENNSKPQGHPQGSAPMMYNPSRYPS